jgi:hypothetical protein
MPKAADCTNFPNSFPISFPKLPLPVDRETPVHFEPF